MLSHWLDELQLPVARMTAAVNWANINWSALNPLAANSFRFRTETIPFAQPSLFLTASILYLIVIGALWTYMRNRSAWDSPRLTSVSVLHNSILSFWSLAMLLGTAQAVVSISLRDGIAATFCSENKKELQGALWYWAYIYFLSKYYELLDTVIIVLRKRPLTFLHVFHHSIVLLMSWLWLEHGLTYGVSYGILFNTFVHVFMYYFYRQSALKIKVWWKKYITTLQIVQFMSSFVLSLPYLYLSYMRPGAPRCSGGPSFAFSCCLNASFLFLFIRFYVNSYSKRPVKRE